MDPDLFTGYDGELTRDRVFREQDAKAVCSQCPLVADCLAWAQKHDERGIWGGTNEDDRRFLRTGRKPRSHAKTDPEGKTKQERERITRIRIAKNLEARGISYEDIAKEIGVTLGTVYDYFRYERNRDHGEATADQDQQAPASGTGSAGHPNSIRSETSVLKETGS